MKTIDEMIAVMTAYKEGKKIESSPKYYCKWMMDDDPKWDWQWRDYRIVED